MTRKEKLNKPNLHRITPQREWTSMEREKPWFVGYAKSKDTILTNERQRLERRKRKGQQAKSPTPTSTRWTKKSLHHIWSRRKEWKCDSNQGQQASQQRKGVKCIWVPKEIISTMKSTKKVWIQRGKWEVQRTSGNLETWQNWDVYHGMHHIESSLLPSGLVKILDPNSPPMTKITRFTAFLCF
jgi:hypothetical protein